MREEDTFPQEDPGDIMSYQLDDATCRLFVCRIPGNITDIALREYFETFGVVTSVKFARKLTDTQCAFVEFETVEGARDAYQASQAIFRVDYT